MPVTTRLPSPPLPILAWRLVRSRLEARIRRTASALGLRRRALYRLGDLVIPDSEVARNATLVLTRVAPPFLVNHSVRTYLFGAAIGLRDGLRFDPEVLYLAAILHDLGLTEHLAGIGPFELEGAQAARAFLQDQSYDSRKADLVHEAIALHTSIGVATRREPEIALIQLGSGLDVVGLRAEDLATETIAGILAAHPRLHMKRQLIPLAEAKVAGKPDCPLATLVRFGFMRMVRAAPFVE